MDWTGFLFGVELGGHTAATELSLNLNPLVSGSFNGIGSEGASIGVRVGYDHQFASDWVAGVQLSARKANTSTDIDTNLGFSATVEEDYAISLIGRIGWLSTPDTLWYGLAGATWTKATASATGIGSISDEQNGFVVGAGVETALTENLSAFVEYRYTELNETDLLGGNVLTFETSIHSGMFGINYKLN